MYKISIVLLIFLLPLTASAKQVDPTRPLGAVSSVFSAPSTEKKAPLVLQSIIQNGQVKKAVINGQILNIGERYKGFELITINSKGVVLQSSQGRMELSLFSGVIAKSK